MGRPCFLHLNVTVNIDMEKGLRFRISKKHQGDLLLVSWGPQGPRNLSILCSQIDVSIIAKRNDKQTVCMCLCVWGYVYKHTHTHTHTSIIPI